MIEAIKEADGKREIIHNYCIGCGICATRCPESSITLTLQQPVKENVLDYFKEKGLELDV